MIHEKLLERFDRTKRKETFYALWWTLLFAWSYVLASLFGFTSTKKKKEIKDPERA